VKNLNTYEIVVVGGGIAGLSMAALLSAKKKKVCLIEKSILGGRGITLDMKGYKFNFGAHAVYGLDRSIWKQLQQDLDLKIEWVHYDPKRTFYYKIDKLHVMPSNMETLFDSTLLKFRDKLKFIKIVLKLMMTDEIPDETLGIWLSKQKVSQIVKDTFLHLVSSNFFTSEPKKISMKVIIPYYKRLFFSQTGVSYIKEGGGV
jgi:15-cis-phytoene desaturase